MGEGKSWAADRMVVTLGTPELGDDTLGATPTPAGGGGAVGTPEMSMARCRSSRTALGVTSGNVLLPPTRAWCALPCVPISPVAGLPGVSAVVEPVREPVHSQRSIDRNSDRPETSPTREWSTVDSCLAFIGLRRSFLR